MKKAILSILISVLLITMLAMVMFAGVRERLESCDVPKFLQGLPITLIAASLTSVSFLGFSGVVDGIFG